MLDRNKHEIVLKKILFDIYDNRDLASLLGFKGGTACYLFYQLNRFSVDLDFDLLNTQKSDYVYDAIRKVISAYGEIKDEQKKFYTIYFSLSCSKEAQNVKVEISTRPAQQNNYEIINYLGLPVLTLKKEYMVANKLVAVLDRKKLASRDIFDAYFFLKNGWEINEDIIQERSGKTKKEYFAELIDFLQKNGSKIKILQGLGELVDDTQKPFIKNKLINELIYLLEISK